MHYIRCKEMKNHGTTDFPLGYYHVNQMHPQYTMPYHWHEELEFIHIIEGSFQVTVNENNYDARPGDLLIVNSGFLHGGTPCDCDYECLVFSTSLLLGKTFTSSFLNMLNMQELSVREYFKADPDTKLYTLVSDLFELMSRQGAEQQIMAVGLLIQIMGCICAEKHYALTDKSDISRHKNIYLLKRVLDYIQHNYSEKLDLNTLAKLAGMSPKYFCRFFFEMTNRTPIDYVNYYRIERACYQLVNSRDSVTEVALSCGFNDMSYFIKTFKKYKGISPRRYLNDPL